MTVDTDSNAETATESLPMLSLSAYSQRPTRRHKTLPPRSNSPQGRGQSVQEPLRAQTLPQRWPQAGSEGSSLSLQFDARAVLDGGTEPLIAPCRSDSGEDEKRGRTFRESFLLVCDSVGLLSIYLVIAWLFGWDPDQGEERKVVMYKDKAMALLRGVVHFIPIIVSSALIALNARSFYIGGELEGIQNQDTEKLAALQFAAKLHELFMLLSLGSIIATYLRRELAFGDGVPFGALFTTSLFQNLSYLWSPSLWGIMLHKWKRRERKWFLVPLILLCTILGFVVGPSSATLMRPRLGDWPAGGTALWVDRGLDDLYTTAMNDSADISHCLDNGSDLACPAGNWQVLNELSYSYWGQFAPMRTLPDYVYLSSRYSQRALVTKCRAPPHEPPFLYSNAYTISTTPLAPLGDAVAEILSLWWKASRASSHFRYYLDVSFNVDAKQPVVFARCNSWDGGELGIRFPKISSIPRVSGSVETADEIESLLYNRTFRDYESLTRDVQSTLNATNGDPSVLWINDPVLLEAVNASISAILAIPGYGDNSPQLYSCSISAMLADSTASTRTALLKVVDGSPSEFLRNGVFDSSHQPISIDPTWARYLNPSHSATNSTALSSILESAGIWLRSGPAPISYREIIIEHVLTTLIANGIARYSYNAGIRWDLLKNPVNASNLWEGGDWASKLLPSGGGNAFDEPPDSAGSARFVIMAKAQGYAYSWRGKTQMLSMAILSIYVALAAVHLLYSVMTGWSSASWGSPPDIAALALNSATSAALRNTGAGVRTVEVHKEEVRVRSINGNLEMVFQDTDGRRAEMPVVNKMYG